MNRFLGASILFASFIASAAAQDTTPPVADAPRPTAGTYSGSVQQADGTRSAKVKMTIRDITTDGRVTGNMQTSHRLKSCTKRLPMSGTVEKDGGMRLEVEAGAPERCARIYNVKVESGGVSGTFIDGDKTLNRTARKG